MLTAKKDKLVAIRNDKIKEEMRSESAKKEVRVNNSFLKATLLSSKMLDHKLYPNGQVDPTILNPSSISQMKSLERHIDELGTINLIQPSSIQSNSNKTRKNNNNGSKQARLVSNPYQRQLDLTSKELLAQQVSMKPKTTPKMVDKIKSPQAKKPRKPASPPDKESKRIIAVQTIDKKKQNKIDQPTK